MVSQAGVWEDFSPGTSGKVVQVDGGAPEEEKMAALRARLEELGHGN